MAEFGKLAEEVRHTADWLTQRARLAQWLAESMEMLAVLVGELRKFDIDAPELQAPSGMLLWCCDVGKIFVWAAQSSLGTTYEARMHPSSVWLSMDVLRSESASETAAWIADRLEELKAEALKGEPL